jgi:hypothetical protein
VKIPRILRRVAPEARGPENAGHAEPKKAGGIANFTMRRAGGARS